jgi:hypothetical protein
MVRTPTRTLVIGAVNIGLLLLVILAVVLVASSGSSSHRSTAGLTQHRSTTGTTQHPSTTGTTQAQQPAVSKPAWPAPALHDPQVIQVTSAHTNIVLNGNRDYVLKLPKGKPLEAPHGLTIAGGHNVVMTGGTVHVPDKSGAAQLEAQTGTIHIEGVRFTGPKLMEGFDLNESDKATVELENIYIDEVRGSYTTNHADLIQSWAGPGKLLIDGLWGSTNYQGFFLLPNQHYNAPPPTLFDLRNVYINDSQGGYALWLQTKPRVPLHLSNVQVTPNPARTWRGWWLWPKPSTGDATWNQVASTPTGPAATHPRIASAGINYHP